MQLKIDEVGERKIIKGGEQQGAPYYPIKSDGKAYNLMSNTAPAIGAIFECDVKESQWSRNGKQVTSRWATVIRAVKPPLNKITGSLGIGQAVDWFDYCKLAELAHGMASVFEPNDATARAAIVNTALIAFTNGKIALPEQEDDPPPPDDEDHYPEELK